MKSILIIQESDLNPHHRRQNFNPEQEALFNSFLSLPDNYTKSAIFINEIYHQDGKTERWKVQLKDGFSVFIDCSVPAPWSASDKDEFYGTVVVIGYELCGIEYLI